MAAPLAITGLGAICTAGIGAAALRAGLLAGRDGLACRVDAALPLAATMPVGAVTGVLPDGSRGAALAEVAAREALAQAGLPAPGLGLILGSCTGGMRASEASYFSAGPGPVAAAYRDQTIGRSVAQLRQRLGLRGMASAHAEACASVACAMVEAATWVRGGLVPAVLVVGADPLTRLTMAGFASLQVVDPAGCRPFTTGRAGMSLGEGAVALVIEDAAHARRRGAQILGSLLGWGQAADAHHGTAPDPTGSWLERAVRDALTDAALPPSSIGYVSAHGTGTRDNDASEAAALARLCGAVPVASTKRVVGHTMGAAAGFGVAAALLAVQGAGLAPSAGAEGPTLTEVDVVRTHRAVRCAAALVTCLAFGGVNAALVLGGAERCA